MMHPDSGHCETTLVYEDRAMSAAKAPCLSCCAETQMKWREFKKDALQYARCLSGLTRALPPFSHNVCTCVFFRNTCGTLTWI